LAHWARIADVGQCPVKEKSLQTISHLIAFEIPPTTISGESRPAARNPNGHFPQFRFDQT
jgi:hypothetical protein